MATLLPLPLKDDHVVEYILGPYDSAISVCVCGVYTFGPPDFKHSLLDLGLATLWQAA